MLFHKRVINETKGTPDTIDSRGVEASFENPLLTGNLPPVPPGGGSAPKQTKATPGTQIELLLQYHKDCLTPIEEKRELFLQNARPRIFEARRDDLPTIICYGGLGATGLPWLRLGKLLNRVYGNRVEIYSLKGHESSAAEFASITHQDWTKDIQEKVVAARENGYRPILFVSSTSALATIKMLSSLEKSTEGDAFVGAVAMMGPPFELKRRLHCASLKVAEFLYDHSSLFREKSKEMQWPPIDLHHETRHAIFKVIDFMHTHFPKIGNTLETCQIPLVRAVYEYLHNDKFADHPKREVPVSTLLELNKLRRLVKEHGDEGDYKKIDCSLLMLLGEKDTMIRQDVAKANFELFGTPDDRKVFVSFENAPHTVSNGPTSEKRRLLRIGVDWVGKLLEQDSFKIEEPVPARSTFGTLMREVGQTLSDLFTGADIDRRDIPPPPPH